jgi:hypothetical protein
MPLRLLAMVILNSITEDFTITLIHHVSPLLRNDGTYLLWVLCNHIQRNYYAFQEHIREQIATATLSTFDNDVPKYIIFIKNNLCMLSSNTDSTHTHNGLITYILRQLKLSSIPYFLISSENSMLNTR